MVVLEESMDAIGRLHALGESGLSFAPTRL